MGRDSDARPAVALSCKGVTVSRRYIQEFFRAAAIQTVAAHRNHASAAETSRDTRLIVLEVFPLIAAEPADVSMGPKAIVAIGSRLLFAGQQPGDDFFAVDDTVAVIPGANVVNFDLLSSFTPIEIAYRRPQGAPCVISGERLHRDQQASLVVLQASLEIRNERIAQIGTVREELADV